MKKISKPGDMFNAYQAKKHKMKRKLDSMEGGVQTKGKGPIDYSRTKQTVTRPPKVNMGPAQPWTNTATGKMLKSKKKHKTKKKALRSADAVVKSEQNASNKYKKGKKHKAVKKSGSFGGKSNKLGQGGRAAQLKAQGVPGGVIGNLARRAQAAPGQKNFHKSKKK